MSNQNKNSFSLSRYTAASVNIFLLLSRCEALYNSRTRVFLFPSSSSFALRDIHSSMSTFVSRWSRQPNIGKPCFQRKIQVPQAYQQEKTLAFTNNFSASYPPPGKFFSKGVPGHLGHPPLATPLIWISQTGPDRTGWSTGNDRSNGECLFDLWLKNTRKNRF